MGANRGQGRSRSHLSFADVADLSGRHLSISTRASPLVSSPSSLILAANRGVLLSFQHLGSLAAGRRRQTDVNKRWPTSLRRPSSIPRRHQTRRRHRGSTHLPVSLAPRAGKTGDLTLPCFFCPAETCGRRRTPPDLLTTVLEASVAQHRRLGSACQVRHARGFLLSTLSVVRLSLADSFLPAPANSPISKTMSSPSPSA